MGLTFQTFRSSCPANALLTNVPKQAGRSITNAERSGPQTAPFLTWRYRTDSVSPSPANQLF